MENITINAFNATLDALLNSNPHARSKGNDFKVWCVENFNSGARISHIREQRQTTNRVSEQFRYFDPIVVFVCDDEVKRDALIQYVSERLYQQLETVAIVGVSESTNNNGMPIKSYTYEHLLVYKHTAFSKWASEFFVEVEDVMTKKLSSVHASMTSYSLQQIYFGAPGTGKSHSINEITKQMPKENVYRTTFHPDSDYSTFVGCYKPTKEKNAPIRLSYEELVEKLKEYKSTMDQSRACTMLGFQYPDSVREIDEQGKIWDLLHAVGITTGNYDTSIRCGWECYNVSKDKATSISYEFVPQTFLKAYMRAYQTTEPVVLVIEEINRGNCAQIFGDLFQLLDRKNGISEYPIKADEDLRKYLIKELGEDSPAIANGELCLPSNLYIWATMNTSDQSLFPIDAAFKRRWDWKYMKIANMEKGYKIEVEGKHYDWWQFIDKMNGIIGSATSSEDKKIGYFFCKVEEGETIITAYQFVSKVLFYVYGDALKDYDIKDEAFVKEEKDGKKNYFTFSDFYDVKGDVDKVVVAQLLDKFIQADEDKENPA